MIVDYALGIAIIGLNPFQTMLTPTLCVAGALMFKMIWDVVRKWGFPKKQNVSTIASFLFNLLGAFSMGLMAWLTVTVVGVVFPIANRFAVSATLMTVTWIVGAVTNQFCLNGYLMSDRRERI